MSGTLVVLTPNGRRQSVKVTPNTTLLQVLEEACEKQGFNAAKYNLKHHRKVLDISLTVRFAGLPNNCLLEVIEAEVARTEQIVTVGVQTEDGKRAIAEFSPAITVHDVLMRLCPHEVKPNTVVIYMRNELHGDNLKKHTLKSLGITSGRAMLRLLHRSPEELKVQANVSAPLPSKPVEEKPYKRQFQPIADHQPVAPKPLPTPSTQPADNKTNVGSSSTGHDTELRHKQAQQRRPENMVDMIRQEKRKQTEGLKIKSQVQRDVKPLPSAPPAKEDFIFLGARNAMLFSYETARTVSSDDLPDDFFELSITDVKKLFRDIKKRRLDLESGMLKTAAMRDLEASRKQLQTLNHYKKTVIRVEFPDRLVLQGVFQPSETVQDVINFVREYIADKRLPFYLFTTPPKTILDRSLTLLEAECVPGALLHFGSDLKCDNYLRSDILDKVVSTSSAATAASKARMENVRLPYAMDEDDIDIGEFWKPPASATTGSGTSSETMEYEPRSHVPPTDKLPKWYKPPK